MSDVDTLLGWFETKALLRPARGASTVDLIRALARLSGAVGFDGPHVQALCEAIGEAEHLLFVLVDGLGLNLIERQPEGAFLRRHQARELRSVFPSATASAITALATADWPARHAVPGWWTHFPDRELTAVSLPFIERFDGTPLGDLGIEAPAVYPLPAVLDRLTRDAHCFQPARISDSAYSNYFRGQAPNGGYDDLPDAIEQVAARIESAAAPTYTYLYISTLDEAQHIHGPSSTEVALHLGEIDAALAGLHARLTGKARLVVSADHGLIEVPQDRRHVLLEDDALLGLLRVPPSGEPRAPLFHVRDGQQDAFAAAFRARYGERYALLTTAEVEQLELLGPGSLGPETRARIGDFLAVARGPDVMLSRQGDRPSGTERMLGHHGGLLPDEVRVPCVLA